MCCCSGMQVKRVASSLTVLHACTANKARRSRQQQAEPSKDKQQINSSLHHRVPAAPTTYQGTWPSMLFKLFQLPFPWQMPSLEASLLSSPGPHQQQEAKRMPITLTTAKSMQRPSRAAASSTDCSKNNLAPQLGTLAHGLGQAGTACRLPHFVQCMGLFLSTEK
mmetsp:Transcript_43710/g.83940  ORF Transcript_43710/g.83940 Transcript_43710/m.83940 type:complete len:165 (-) Transcript_43710:699-1193(-)